MKSAGMPTSIEAGVQLYTLDNGMRAVVKQRSSIPLVTIAIGARGGIHNEVASTAGLTGLAVRASLKGTHTRSAADIAIIAESMGGSISPSVSADVLDWEITVPARHFERALDLLGDVAFNPSFPEMEFDIERKLALADIHQSRDDMYRYPLRLCVQQAFRGHAYGSTIATVESALADATPDTARAWHHAQINGEPWVFVVGDIDPDAAARRIEMVAREQSAARAPQPSRAVWPGGGSDEDARDKAQTAIAIAFPAPVRDDDDAHVMHVLSNAVGGLGGRFFEELRSKRSLAYTINLIPVTRWLGGAFIAYLATSPEREEEARSALLEQFARLLDEPLSAEELQRSQRYTIGTWQIRSQTNGAQLGDLMHAYLVGGGIAEILEFEKHIRSVTAQDVLRVAQHYFDPTQAVTAIVRGKDNKS